MTLSEKEIYLLSEDNQLKWDITKRLVEENFTINTSATLVEGLGKVYESPPALLIIDQRLVANQKNLDTLRIFKSDNLFSHIPVILIVSLEWEKVRINWENYPIDDYITYPFRPQEITNRVMLCITKFQRLLVPNPLTGLPGNISILRKIQKALDLGMNIAIAYLDVDNFKSFNDKYGFSRGDEALRMTARILSNVVQGCNSDEAFIGHVGGDDFVMIIPNDLIDKTCQEVMKSFDSIITSLYDEEDREKGCIISKDRSGNTKTFPIMGISIAVISNEGKRFAHYGEVSQIASEIKKLVKKDPLSSYFIDRRKPE